MKKIVLLERKVILSRKSQIKKFAYWYILQPLDIKRRIQLSCAVLQKMPLSAMDILRYNILMFEKHT